MGNIDDVEVMNSLFSCGSFLKASTYQSTDNIDLSFYHELDHEEEHRSFHSKVLQHLLKMIGPIISFQDNVKVLILE